MLLLFHEWPRLGLFSLLLRSSFHSCSNAAKKAKGKEAEEAPDMEAEGRPSEFHNLCRDQCFELQNVGRWLIVPPQGTGSRVRAVFTESQMRLGIGIHSVACSSSSADVICEIAGRCRRRTNGTTVRVIF
jgi:hypothetical protein